MGFCWYLLRSRAFPTSSTRPALHFPSSRNFSTRRRRVVEWGRETNTINRRNSWKFRSRFAYNNTRWFNRISDNQPLRIQCWNSTHPHRLPCNAVDSLPPHTKNISSIKNAGFSYNFFLPVLSCVGAFSDPKNFVVGAHSSCSVDTRELTMNENCSWNSWKCCGG